MRIQMIYQVFNDVLVSYILDDDIDNEIEEEL